MNIFLPILLCIASMAQATLEIDNRSTYPFQITSVTYEHNNGLRKTPFIELTPIVVQPQSVLKFPAARREPILNITGQHANKNYSLDLPTSMIGFIMITPDNQVRLLGPQFITNQNVSEPATHEKPPKIQRL